MIRKILHSGLIMQILLLFSIVAGALIIYKPDPKITTATSSFTLAESTIPGKKINSPAPAKKNEPGDMLSSHYDEPNSLSEPPLPPPTEGPGGPILVISSATNPFSRYSVELLRAEGLNHFAAADLPEVTTAMLDKYDVVILGEMIVSENHFIMLTNWVHAGGTLIAFKPCTLLSPLFGITPSYGTLKDKYLLINTGSGPGAGIVNQTIQYHGTADLHTLNGATSLATLYSSATSATINPAITLRNAGRHGGVAVAFTYDLAKSIVYTRQGNPAWAGQKRDEQINPIRSDDMFFPDWLDLDKVAIPQADEQQRLLANIILQGNLHRKPLPRFWYLPRDLKAAIVMTGDDHAMNETYGRFKQYMALGPNTAEDIADWKAIRATSYIYPNTKMTNAQAAAFEAQGFEIALHPNTNCANYTLKSLQNIFATQLTQLSAKLPAISAPVTNRTHCLAWSDWASTPKVELQNGIRLDASYYYWPASWIQNRPGMFTGSGLPMRFADMDGTIIDNYQLVTQMTDESGIDVSNFCNQLLNKAIGAEGYYGVFCANMHTDIANHKGSDSIIASARARQVPIISAKQLLNWLDGRNNSFFSNISWINNRLSFNIIAHSRARNLKAMLPLYSENGKLVSVTINGKNIPFTIQTIKGMQYAFFPAALGTNSYVAGYGTASSETTEEIITKTEKIPEGQWNKPPELPRKRH